ncbi:MAG: peptide MFS transporter [Muribaculaceae bacterium]|nr:peptide MFS transporter [Muribaculaceae bacterium]
MFKNQPAGLYVLALANTGERFGYYTMLAIFLLFLQAKFGFDAAVSGQIYAGFLAMVYFMPLIGGWVADRWSFNKCVITGIVVMFLGYAIMSMQTPIHSNFSLGILIVALLLISVGTGLFKGNLQVMVGDLYNEPKYSSQRDSAFSLFYMAINIGSMFAPMTATAMLNWHMHRVGLEYVDGLPAACNALINAQDAGKVGEIADLSANVQEIAAGGGLEVSGNVLDWANSYITALSNGYSWGFAIACLSLIVSYCIYAFGKRTYRHIISNKKDASAKTTTVNNGPELTPAQTKARVVALLLVFAVVIFFWMVFHQNGATLTEFAKTCTSSETYSWTRIGFNVGALAIVAVGIYALFSIFQSKKSTGKIVSGLILAGCVVAIIFIFKSTPNPLTGIQPQQYQQFNPFYVVALTPVSLAIFGWLASRKKEPSAPRKIGYGMLMAGAAYAIMCIGSASITGTEGAVSPNWLISTYLVLTFAELLLSPMGISFVSKVAPPKLKGSMMGGWFAATAVGNYLVSIPMILWGKLPLWALWGILIIICLISAVFIFSMMKKLEAATNDEPSVDPVAQEMANASETE